MSLRLLTAFRAGHKFGMSVWDARNAHGTGVERQAIFPVPASLNAACNSLRRVRNGVNPRAAGRCVRCRRESKYER
jgi:hypothetical protein